MQRPVYDEVSAKLVAFAKTARLRDPMAETTQVGPITTLPKREGAELHRYRSF